MMRRGSVVEENESQQETHADGDAQQRPPAHAEQRSVRLHVVVGGGRRWRRRSEGMNPLHRQRGSHFVQGIFGCGMRATDGGQIRVHFGEELLGQTRLVGKGLRHVLTYAEVESPNERRRGSGIRIAATTRRR